MLVLADPLLVRSVGFQLSVAATVAIVVGARPISRLLWGPSWLRLALAATLSAQAGVLPVQLAVFGSLPLVSIPANVLAGPIAGPAMVWGLIGGLAGGVSGDAVASVLHVPTRLMMGWVAGVARWGAALGWPHIEASEVAAAVAVIGLCTAVAYLFRARGAVPRGLAIAVAGVGVWVVAGAHRPSLPSGAHLSVQRGDPIVVVVDRPDPARALDTLAAAGIDDIDVLVARSASRAGREVVRALDARHEIARVLAPVGLGGSVSHEALRQPVAVGGLQVTPSAGRLDIAPAVASNAWQAEP